MRFLLLLAGLLALVTAAPSPIKTKSYLLCRDQDSQVCPCWQLHPDDLEKNENYFISNRYKACGLSDLKPVRPNRHLYKISSVKLDEPFRLILCRHIYIVNEYKTDPTHEPIHLNRGRRSPRGKFRGQTQSQYLSIDQNKDKADEGKAEAHSAVDSSRATVSGRSGMGQAQSQSIYDPSCEDCYNENEPENLKDRDQQRHWAGGPNRPNNQHRVITSGGASVPQTSINEIGRTVDPGYHHEGTSGPLSGVNGIYGPNSIGSSWPNGPGRNEAIPGSPGYNQHLGGPGAQTHSSGPILNGEGTNQPGYNVYGPGGSSPAGNVYGPVPGGRTTNPIEGSHQPGTNYNKYGPGGYTPGTDERLGPNGPVTNFSGNTGQLGVPGYNGHGTQTNKPGGLNDGSTTKTSQLGVPGYNTHGGGTPSGNRGSNQQGTNFPGRDFNGISGSPDYTRYANGIQPNVNREIYEHQSGGKPGTNIVIPGDNQVSSKGPYGTFQLGGNTEVGRPGMIMTDASGNTYICCSINPYQLGMHLSPGGKVSHIPETGPIGPGGQHSIITSRPGEQVIIDHGGLNQPYVPGQQGSYAPGSQGSYLPGQQGSYSPGQQGSYSPGQQGSYGPGSQGSYGPGQQGSYGPGQLSSSGPGQHSTIHNGQSDYRPGQQGSYGPGQQSYGPGQLLGPAGPGQQGSYSPGQQGFYGPGQQGPYVPGQQQPYGPEQQGTYEPGQLGGPNGPGKQSSYVPGQQGSYGPGQQGSYGPGQQGSYGPGQHGSTILGQQGPYGPGQQGSHAPGQQGSYAPGQLVGPTGPGQQGITGIGQQGSNGPGQHGSTEPGQQGSYMPGQQGSYMPGQQGFNGPGQDLSYLPGQGSYLPGQQGTYGPGHGSTGPGQQGSYGPGIDSYGPDNQGSYMPGQHGSTGTGQHGSYGPGQQGYFGPGQQGSYRPGQQGYTGTGQQGTYGPNNKVLYGNGKQDSFGPGQQSTYVPGQQGSYRPGQQGSYGPGQFAGSTGPGQQGVTGPGQQGSYGPGNHGSIGPAHQGSYGPGQQGSHGPGQQGYTGTEQQGPYGPGQRGSTGTGQQGSYSPVQQGSGTGQQGSYGPILQGSTGTGQQGSLGPRQQGSYSPGQQGSIGTGQQGSYGPGQQASTGIGQQGSYGPGQQGITGTGQQGPYGPGQQGSTGTVPQGLYGPGQQGSTGTGQQGSDIPGHQGQYGPGQQGAFAPGLGPGGMTNNIPATQGGSNGAGGVDVLTGQPSQQGGVPQNVLDPNAIGAIDDDSEAQATVSQGGNGTVASASSKGGNDKGRAQTQVQGTYSGSGSFSAQAQITDESKGAESQVTGSKQGASSSAQGKGRNNKSQAQVELGSETGSLQTHAQSEGVMHSSNSQVQGSVKGGMADAQARGPGSTSSQAQIGFTPYKEGDKTHEQFKSPFNGGGSASAQSSGRTGQTQSQLQGTFKYGIQYNGAAQAGASIDKDAVFPNRLPFNKLDVFDEATKNIDVDTVVPNTESPYDNNTIETMKQSETKTVGHSHSEHHNGETQSPINSRRSFHHNHERGNEFEYSTSKFDSSDYYDPEAFGSEGVDAEPEYTNYDDFSHDLTHQPLQSSHKKGLDVKQSNGGSTQHIVLGSLRGHDAEITQQSSEQRPDESRIYQPGERVPGTGGYTIPMGFTGSVKSVSSKEKTYAIGSRDSPSQAQTVALSPGTGKVKYVYSKTNPKVINPKNLKSLDPKKNDNRYMSVSKSVSGALDGDNNIKKQYSHTYYTKSSSCGYFTFTCNIVSGSNGRKKVCKPKIPTNPDGTPMNC